MNDELTRAIAEILDPAHVEATEAEIRADEIEHILTHIMTGPRSPATNALERRLAGLRNE